METRRQSRLRLLATSTSTQAHSDGVVSVTLTPTAGTSAQVSKRQLQTGPTMQSKFVSTNCAADDAANDNNGNQFLNLPALVTDEILDYLHMNSLKNLRLVSRTTKLWIDQRPKLLRKLPLYVKNEARLSGLLSESESRRIRWTHATIPTEILKLPSLALFFRTYASSLKSVKIGYEGEPLKGLNDYCRDYPSTEHLVSNVLSQVGPSLTSLRLHGLFELSGRDDDEPAQAKLSKLRLPNLLLLEFEADDSKELGAPRFNSFIAGLLKMCPNLTTLKLPIKDFHIHISLESAEQRKKVLHTELLPLTSYLRQMATRTLPGQTSVQLIFDKDRSAIPMNLATLLELAEACRPLGGQLLNVPDTLLPTIDQSRLLSAQQLVSLDSSIGSVLCTSRLLISLQSSVYVPLEAEIVIRCGRFLRDNLSHFQLNQSLKITSIGVDQRYEWSRRNHVMSGGGRENLRIQLFGVIRPSVEHLRLGSDRNTPSIVPLASQFKTCFPNLKTLSLSSSTGGSDYTNQVIIRLPSTVEQIHILENDVGDFCFTGGHLNLSGPGPTGKYYAPMHVRLPNLTQLTLKRCGMSALSNNIFESTVQHMSLKVFSLIPADPFRGPNCEIKFHEGLSWLIRGNLKDSLEKLECFIPSDTSEEEMTTFFSAFHRMKTCCLSELAPTCPGGGVGVF